MFRQTQTLEERFWSKVDQNGPVIREDLGACWVFTGYRKANGYGYFRMPKASGNGWTSWNASRVAYYLTHPEFDLELSVLHHCDFPPCCRPDHLFQGTHLDNMADMRAKGRQLSGDRNPSRTHPGSVHRGEENHYARLTTEDVLTIRRRYASGERARDIAADFGIVQLHVNQIARGRVWAHVGEIVSAEVRQAHQRAHLRGENGGTAKLTTAQVLEMRRRHADGESATEMAGDYPIAVHSITGVLLGNSWKHVLMEAQ